jgi:electron transport complex protein RnfA
MDMMKITAAAFGAIFINNFVFSRFLGFCPFFSASKNPVPALIMGAVVAVMMSVSSAVLYPLNHFVLIPLKLDKFLQTAVFVILTCMMLQGAELILKRLFPGLSKSLGVFLPLLASNCAVLGTALIVIRENYDMTQGLIFSFSSGIGFTLAIFMMSSVRERIDGPHVPAAFRGLPASFIAAGLMALSMYGFSGILK